MSKDIVDRLLSTGEHLAKEAAYEIERLQEDKADILEILKKAHVWHEKLSTLVSNCAVEIERLQQRDGFIAKLDEQIIEKDAEIERLQKKCDTQAMILRRLSPDKFPDTYFIHSGMGEKDKNGMPERLLVCPAYGVDFSYVYEYTGMVSGTEW